MPDSLRDRVYHANMTLAASGLVTGTFGNVSGADHDAGVMLIKPSGVPYETLTAGDLVPVSLKTGAVLEGTLRPSSDTPTHLELYRAFGCGGVVHTHSTFATAFAQARLQARHGAMPDERAWHALEASRTAAHYLALARGGTFASNVRTARRLGSVSLPIKSTIFSAGPKPNCSRRRRRVAGSD